MLRVMGMERCKWFILDSPGTFLVFPVTNGLVNELLTHIFDWEFYKNKYMENMKD